MASSGSFTTTECEGRSLTFSWTQASQSVANNTTTISWELKGSGSYTYGWVTCGGFKVVINGSTVYNTSTDYRLNVYSGTVVASGTHTIFHNSNGSKTFSASAQAGIYTYAVNCSGSGTWSLNSIPRASTITSASSITLGNACNIKWTPADSTFKYKIKFALGNWYYTTGYISPAATSEYTYTGYTISGTTTSNSTTIYAQLPNKTSGTMTATLYTYNSGGTQIGSDSSKTFTVTIPSSVIPTVGTVALNPTFNNATYSYVIQDKTKLGISVSGCAAGTGSTIQSYSFSGPSISKTVSTTSASSSVTSDQAISSAEGTLSYTITVTDARGRSNSKTVNISCYAWVSPTIKLSQAFRVLSTSDTVENSSGTIVKFKCDISYAAVNNTNNVNVTLYYKSESDTSWRTASVLTNSKNTTVTYCLDGFSTNLSYNLYATISDQYYGSGKSQTLTVFSEERILSIRPNGTGVAFGKMASTDSVLDSKWPIRTDGSVTATGGLTAGSSTQTSAPTNGISVHDIRNVTVTPNSLGDKNANFYFQKVNNIWHSILHAKGYSGTYAAWELAGNAHNSSNDNALKYRQGIGDTWQDWQTVLTNKNYTDYSAPKPVTLYNNSSGTTGTVTLSETAANYSYLEIFLYKDGTSGWWSVKVPSPNGKTVQVGTTYYTNASGVGLQVIGKTVSVSGTSITAGTEFYMNFNDSTGAVKAIGGQTSIKIMRVDGYK